MCINFQTSIIAFLLGEFAGLFLVTEFKEKRLIGLFVMFYSIVQFLEASIYYYEKSAEKILSQLLLINLGFQGLVFFILMNELFEVPNFYLFTCCIISIFIICKAFSDDFVKASLDNCLTWNFIDKETGILLSLMYIMMFIWFFSKGDAKLNIENNFINNTGLVLFFTFVISYFILKNKNSPSIWCLSSAISAPFLILL